jgi:hypothetical protein
LLLEKLGGLLKVGERDWEKQTKGQAHSSAAKKFRIMNYLVRAGLPCLQITGF